MDNVLQDMVQRLRAIELLLRTQNELVTGVLAELSASIDRAVSAVPRLFENGFVVGGRASLERIHQYYAALSGLAPFPRVQCNAPWVSAVLEPDGGLRPCFFQPLYGSAIAGLPEALNSDQSVAFRRGLDVGRNATCQRCVCSLNVPLSGAV